MLKAWCWWSCWGVVTPVKGGVVRSPLGHWGVLQKRLWGFTVLSSLSFVSWPWGECFTTLSFPPAIMCYHETGLKQRTNQLWTATFQTVSPNKPRSFVNELVQIFCELTQKTWKSNFGTNNAKDLCFALQSCFFKMILFSFYFLKALLLPGGGGTCL